VKPTAKLNLAEKALKELGPRREVGPRPSLGDCRGKWPKVCAKWAKRARDERQRSKLEARIAYFKERIEALRDLPRGARALLFPPL